MLIISRYLVNKYGKIKNVQSSKIVFNIKQIDVDKTHQDEFNSFIEFFGKQAQTRFYEDEATRT